MNEASLFACLIFSMLSSVRVWSYAEFYLLLFSLMSFGESCFEPRIQLKLPIAWYNRCFKTIWLAHIHLVSTVESTSVS